MLELIQLGDMHLDKLRKYWPNANRLQVDAYRRVIRSRLREGYRHFVLCGDIADGIKDATGNMIRLSEDGQREFLSFLKEFDGKAQIDIIPGNHDFSEEGHHSLGVFMEMQRLRMFETVRIHDKPTVIDFEGVRVNFLPWPHREPTDRCDVAVAHYEVHGAISDSGRVITLQNESEHDYGVPFLQGHLHTKQKKGRHHYGGTLYQTSFGESLPKGYAMARVARGRFAWKFVPDAPPFKLVNLRVYDRKDFAHLTTDPLTLFKLFVADDVKTPDGLMDKYPNIVNSLEFASEEELEQLEQAELALEIQGVEVNVDDYLPDYFKSKGASDKMLARAYEVLDEFNQ